MKHTAIRRVIITAAVAGGTIAGATGVAGAAEPVVQACVGTTFSGSAAALPPPGVGTTVSFFAQNTTGSQPNPGLGDGIQQLQAGEVPDSGIANTCN